MPSKTHTTAVVLIPPESLQPPIQSIRERHDRNFYRWMPHITLLYPFAERAAFADVVPALGAAVQEISPFSVRFAEFDAFRHRKSCTLFLVPEPATAIIGLHAALTAHLPDYDDTARFPNGYHPHLSVGQFRHPDIRAEQARLQGAWVPMGCEMGAVSLIYRDPETGDRFVVAEEFPLSG